MPTMTLLIYFAFITLSNVNDNYLIQYYIKEGDVLFRYIDIKFA